MSLSFYAQSFFFWFNWKNCIYIQCLYLISSFNNSISNVNGGTHFITDNNDINNNRKRVRKKKPQFSKTKWSFSSEDSICRYQYPRLTMNGEKFVGTKKQNRFYISCFPSIMKWEMDIIYVFLMHESPTTSLSKVSAHWKFSNSH